MKDNWFKNKLSEIVIIRHGYQFRDYDFVSDGIDVIKIGQIGRDGKLKLENSSKIEYTRLNNFKNIQLYNGDVLMALTGATLGKTAIVKNITKLLVQNYRVGYFTPKNDEQLDKLFLYYLLISENVQNEILNFINAGAQGNIGKADFEKIELDFPPLPQQQKIAKILSTCDKVIEQTEAAIAKYQALKQGMMHDLFTHGIDTKTGKLRPRQTDSPELYKQSELGLIPKEWEIRKLDEITSYVDYRGKTPPKSDKGIFLITAKNIKQGYIDYEISQEYIPVSAYNSAMSRGIPKIGDVLITTEAPLGNIAQIDNDNYALAQRVIKYRCLENEMINDFLKHSLMSEYLQKLLESEATGSTVKGIKGSRLHKLNILRPTLYEQEKIISSLFPLEAKIKTEQSTLLKYKQIKSGLMQDLLSGKVEVIV